MRKSHSALSDLFYSVLSGGAISFEKYLTRGGNKNIQCSEGISVLMYSIKSQNRELFDLCFRVDVNKNLTDSKQNTAVNIAAITSDVYYLKKLLEQDVKINSQNYQGNSPLMLSILNGQSESAMLLLHSDCEINIINKDGNTALHLLIINNPEFQFLHEPITPLLNTFVQNNVNWTIRNNDYAGGCTPLMCAVNNKDIALVNTILDTCDKNNFTDELLQLFLGRNQCYKEVLLLKGVNPCVYNYCISTIHQVLKRGTLSDIYCIVQNYAFATCSSNNGFLEICFGAKTEILPINLIKILVNCGLQITQYSSFLHLSEKLFIDLNEYLEKCDNIPVSLKYQCRTTIRKHLKFNLQEKIFTLPLPKSVNKFLLFFNEFSYKYSYNVNKFFKHKMLLK